MINKKSIFAVIIILIIMSISTVQAAEINDIDDVSINDDSNSDISVNTLNHKQTTLNNAPLNANKIIIPTYISVANNNTDFKTNQSNSLNISLIDINKDGLEGKEIIFVINESIISAKTTDSEGNAYLNLDNLPNGEYVIRYSFAGDDDYTSSTNTTTITISDYIPTTIPTFIRAQSLTYKKGTIGNFIITLTDINGTTIPNQKVLVTINGEESTWYTNNEGQVSIICQNYDIGTYNVSFIYPGKDQYFPSNGTSIITVVNETAILTSITAEDMNLTVNDMKDFIISLRDENGDPMPYKEVIVDFNGETQTWYTDLDGDVKILLYELSMGIYPITYTFEGEGDYSPCKGSNVITVTNPNITNTTISGIDMNLSVGDVENFIITLKTAKGTPIANQTVRINFLTNLTKTTNEEGQVEITLYELKAGTYEIEYAFDGKGDYLPSKGKNTIYVDPYDPGALTTTITGNDIKMDVNETKNFTVTLKDSNNRNLANQPVYFTFNNITMRQYTNTNGQATITFSDLANGTYTVYYQFNGTSRLKNSSGSNKIIVSNGTVPPGPGPEPPVNGTIPTQFFSSDMTVYEGNIINFITILTDENGTLLGNKPVVFTFNGTEINITTDLYGQAILNLTNLTNGTYLITFQFKGDNTYNATSGNNTLTVRANPVENNTVTTVIQAENLIKAYGSDDSFKGKLLDTDGNLIAGQHINIKVTRLSSGASKVYDVVSNYLGEFTLPINLAAGSYLAEVNYTGMTLNNITYKPSTATNTITVVENRTQTVLTALKFNEPYGANKTFTGTLKDINDNPLAGHTVTVLLTRLSTGANKTYNTIANYLGEYNLDINLAPGEYTAQCAYAGSTIYQPSSASNTITVY